MTLYYTSDLHIGHAKICEYEPQRYEYLGLRPGDGVPEMNEALVRLWNDQVTDEDHVIVCGDMCMGRIEESMAYVRRLRGRKSLVAGNHDRVHPSHGYKPEKAAQWERVYREAGFEEICLSGVWDFDGVTCRVSHFPYHGDSTGEERYLEYRPDDNGLPLVCGHIHGAWKTNGNMLNVGIDAWNGKFQTASQIADHFRSIGFTS